MIEPIKPYLLFNSKFIRKYGNRRSEHGAWDFRQDRETFEKKWWKAGCFAIDAEMRRFELVEVVSEGPAWIIDNLFQPHDRVFLSIKLIFRKDFQQLDFETARDIFVETVCKRRWCSHSGETPAEFRTRNEKYTNWRDLIEPVSLKGRWP